MHRFRKLQQMSSADRALLISQCARSIYATYIDPTTRSPLQINIEASAVATIKATIQKSGNAIPITVFDQALKEVSTLMYNNTFRPMVDTPAFDACVQILNADQYAPKASIMARHFGASTGGRESRSHSQSRSMPEWKRAAMAAENNNEVQRLAPGSAASIPVKYARASTDVDSPTGDVLAAHKQRQRENSQSSVAMSVFHRPLMSAQAAAPRSSAQRS